MAAQSVLVCNVNALTAEQHARLQSILPDLMATAQEIEELADGYAIRFPPDGGTYHAIAEYISLERLCCPFFHFVLEVQPDGGPLWLRLTGPDGVKAFIREELGLSP